MRKDLAFVLCVFRKEYENAVVYNGKTDTKVLLRSVFYTGQIWFFIVCYKVDGLNETKYS